MLKGDTERMLPVVEATLEDIADGEIRARLRDRAKVLEDLADPPDDVADVFVMVVEGWSCEKSTTRTS